MKNYFLFLFFYCIGLNAQIINIPDPNFKAILLQADVNDAIAVDSFGNNMRIDSNNDGEIQLAEAILVRKLNIMGHGNYNIIANIIGIENFSNLNSLDCSFTSISNLNVSNLTSLELLDCSGTQISILDLSNLSQLKKIYYRSTRSLVNIIYNNTLLIEEINCGDNNLSAFNLSPFPNLKYFNCNDNNISNLDLTPCPNLVSLQCAFNNLNLLNISGLLQLKGINCGNNPLLTEVNFSLCPSLEGINCDNNVSQNLINLTGLTNLKNLNCKNTSITSLNVTTCPELVRLDCSHNQLTTLDLLSNIKLFVLDCSYNLLTSLELNDIGIVESLNCSNNVLNSMIIKGFNRTYINGMGDIYFNNNPNLQYICAKDTDVVYFQNVSNAYGYTNCHVNTYCSFTPGGIFYSFYGYVKFDDENDSCDVSDFKLTNLRFDVSDGSTHSILNPYDNGNYTFSVVEGVHTITPVFENPSFFNVFPNNVVVNFPAQASPFNQNFCVTPNGVHSDVEISILPINSARPGFNGNYKIVFKNKGNQFENGSVTLTFDDSKMDYVSSNPLYDGQVINQLTWNFSALQPFETRTIDVVFNINTPMETPAVNGGDILNYTASITSGNTDEMPSDNTFTLNQTVVNSYDPNDKTCLEGNTIPPSKIGDYVHYMIRFENNGTANAQNIVVKDMVDLDKFEINSLVSMKGSHSFVTNITSGNKVEFIFENINLPFDDANNDGYVSFKIKTKPTLVNGDTFSNTASIYFDYNFPIVTNTATTTIAALNRQDFEFSNYLSVYPNPVHDVLNITAKETIEISSITIYNTLGQLVLVIPNAKEMKTIDVSSLTSGNYFIKINSDKGTSNTKFIKQ